MHVGVAGSVAGVVAGDVAGAAVFAARHVSHGITACGSHL